jgi:CubicO group peptidase (beta-lactamase class C family)
MSRDGQQSEARTGRGATSVHVVVAFLACLNLARVGLGATPLEIDVTISNAVDAQFAFATGVNSSKPGGVVGVALDGELVFQRAYGMADVAGQLRNSTTMPFYLASCSKQFMAMSVLLCEEKGLLSLTNGIRQYIPELHTNFNGVTIQHMLNMISAIYDVGTGNQTNTATGMLSGLLDEGQGGIVVAQKPIGSTFKYCNMNYVLLGIIVERVSGKTLRQFSQDEIFSPLGMTDTTIRDTLSMVVTNQPNGYDASLALWSTASSNSPATGSTGVSSTLADLLKWHENMYANKLGLERQSLIDVMETPGRYTSGTNAGLPVSSVGLGFPSYACGVMPDSYRGNARVWHTGRWMGFKTAMCRYPNLHLSVFILVNRDDLLPSFQTVADAFLNNVRFAKPPPSSSAQQGTPYAFTYVATGSPRPLFSLESGAFPTGLTLSTNGAVAGTPTVPGDFSGVVKAVSGVTTQTQAFAIHVAPAPAIGITASSLGSGVIAPSGIIAVAYGSSVSITNIPSAWYHVGTVTVDGVSIGAPAVHTFTNVMASHTILVTFVADTVASNTPAWWLAQANPVWTTNLDASAMGDQDGDGLFTWQEYISGTHPTNSSSVFSVHAAWSNDQCLISIAPIETSSEYEGLNRYYTIESRTNLVEGEWEPVAGFAAVRATGQVQIVTGVPGSTNRFYRGRVWLAP